MNRREFIASVATHGAAAGVGIAAAANYSKDRVAAKLAANETFDAARQHVVDGMENLEARVDKLEHHHRNLLRVGALAVAISTGVDLTILL